MRFAPKSFVPMTALADRIDRLNTAVGRAVAWLALAIVLVQFGLVVARYIFGLGSIWLTETVIYGNAAASVRAKAKIDLAGSVLLLLPFALVLVWLSVPYAARSWAILERSQETSGLPLVFMLKTLIPLFAGMMALQGVAQAIRALAVLRAR
jgi:TRAP-type mannitol/chloroaromatic compound transport system permease small subunit